MIEWFHCFFFRVLHLFFWLVSASQMKFFSRHCEVFCNRRNQMNKQMLASHWEIFALSIDDSNTFSNICSCIRRSWVILFISYIISHDQSNCVKSTSSNIATLFSIWNRTSNVELSVCLKNQSIYEKPNQRHPDFNIDTPIIYHFLQISICNLYS